MAVVADDQHRASKPFSACTSASRASTSRWLVGSPRISRCAPRARISASASRARSPPDSLPTSVVALLPEKAEASQLRAHRWGSCSPPSWAAERVSAPSSSSTWILGEITDAHLARDCHAALFLASTAPRAGARASSCRCRCGRAAQCDRRDRYAGSGGATPARRAYSRRWQGRAISGLSSSPGLSGNRTPARIVGDRRNRLHPGELLGARLRLLRGRGARAVAGDIVLQFGALRVLRRLRRRKLRRAFGALALERVIAAGVERHLPAFEMQNMVDDIVEQVAFMADHDKLPRIGAQEASSHIVASRSRWSTVRRAAAGRGREDSAASATRIFHPPEKLSSGRSCISSSKPSPIRMRAARAGAV